MKAFKVTVTYSDGSGFSLVETKKEWDSQEEFESFYEEGEWDYPFPNEKEDCFAFAWVESGIQSDMHPLQSFHYRDHGYPVTLKCESIEVPDPEYLQLP